MYCVKLNVIQSIDKKEVKFDYRDKISNSKMQGFNLLLIAIVLAYKLSNKKELICFSKFKLFSHFYSS